VERAATMVHCKRFNSTYNPAEITAIMKSSCRSNPPSSLAILLNPMLKLAHFFTMDHSDYVTKCKNTSVNGAYV